jgi:hypothetical protein
LFQFLNPIWLFAAAALIVPVVVHLWNIRPGKVLKVGSILLIPAAVLRKTRSLILSDIPLFILRCLLLLLLALLLAAPVWQKKLSTAGVTGWLLIPKENFKDCYQRFKGRIDSLANAGYAFHYLNRDFTPADLKTVLLQPPDSAMHNNAGTPPANYWNLIRRLDTKVASALPVYLFTPGQARYFTGQKPRISLNLHWQTYTPADSTAGWIAGAWLNNQDNIRVLQGVSKPSGTAYSYSVVQHGSPVTVTFANGRPSVNLTQGQSRPVAIDTSVLRLAIYADHNAADAVYLHAALAAAATLIPGKTTISQYNDARTIPDKMNWLFWLSEKPVAKNVRHMPGNLLYYETGKVIGTDSWLIDNSAASAAFGHEQKTGLFKSISAPPSDDSVLWHDGLGRPLLRLQAQGSTKIYHFYTRFSPGWNDLVWSSEFPAWLLQLITTEKAPAIAGKNDRRVLDTEQVMPGHSDEPRIADVKTTTALNLTKYFWLILAMLFLAERRLSGKTQNKMENGGE